MFNNKEDFKTHTDDHFFNEVRILSAKTSNFDYAAYLSFKEFLKKKEKLKNSFVFQVPPPDFTKEDYQSFAFPKPIDEYIQADLLSAKLKKLPRSNGYRCNSCKMTLNDMKEGQEHFLKMHDVHFTHKNLIFGIHFEPSIFRTRFTNSAIKIVKWLRLS